jgi:hypothetical protein
MEYPCARHATNCLCGFSCNVTHMYLDFANVKKQVLYVYPTVYCSMMLALKPAILLGWIRIFVPARSKGPLFWTASGLIAVNIMLWAAVVIILNFQCVPREKVFNRQLLGYCIDRK